ncbi:hypothetical protein [Halobellus limi]|uniref:Uncharacterized protein n=1 Tax=Halobellus limi TaxID=699433 RepID=A0A4D6H2F5_9EURY|nr:hypothetical protein [Halobellus limi]QCC48134.1 hypothetical protein DV707_10925 [Halobellus limi]
MVDITTYLLAKLKQLTQLADPTLIQSIIGLYLFYTSVTIATGTFSVEDFQTATFGAIFLIFISYAFGFVLLDEEMGDNTGNE